MRVLFRTVVAMLMLASLLAPLQPAQAAGGGTFVFAGTVALPTFPCSGCVATFDSTVAAGAMGFSDGAAGIITSVHAEVVYSELCTAGQALEGHATGTAAGTGIFSGVNVVDVPLPIEAPFEWTRVGLVALITAVTSDDIITGAAVFVPTGGLPSCTGGSMSAVVAGAATHGSPSRNSGGHRFYDVTAELTVRPGVLGVSFELRNSDPSPDRWTCAAEGYTVTCQPPEAALTRNTTYRCVVVEASVSHVGIGPVSGTSACAGGSATGVSPDNPHAESRPGGDVPFSCSVNPNAALTWDVFCKVRPD